MNFDSKDRGQLLIAIDRWIKSKASGSEADKIIDVGIALEALYVTRKDRIEQQLRHRSSWYLGKDATHRADLETELTAIYEYRCDVVHNRMPGKEVEVGQRSVPVTDLVQKRSMPMSKINSENYKREEKEIPRLELLETEDEAG